MKIHLSIVIPCYNEEVNIRLGAFDKVQHFLEKQKFNWEVIVVDDGSTDGSRQLTYAFCRQNKGFHLIENPHQGKAATVITGMLKAQGEYVLFMDLDQAVPIEEVNKLLPWFAKGFEVVIGSRKTKRLGAPLTRRIMAWGFMKLRGLILGMSDIVDTQCGFKAFTREAAQELFSQLTLYKVSSGTSGSRVTAGFDVEILFLAAKKGFKIKEIEVEWYHVDTRRVSPMRDSIEGLIALLQIKNNAMRELYS